MSVPKQPIVGIDIRLIGKQRTGDEVVFFNLTRALLKEGRGEFVFRLFTHEQDTSRLHELRSQLECVGRDDVEFVTLRFGSQRFFWNSIALPWELYRRPVHIYHTQYIAPLFIPRQVKLVTHIHDVSFAAHPEWIAPKDRLFLSLLIPRSLRRANQIVAPSLFTKQEIERYYPESVGKIVVIPNAAAKEWLRRPAKEDIEMVRRKFGLPERYLIAAGTMQPRKNIPLLIEAWAARPPALREVGLVLTGNRFGHHVDKRLPQGEKSQGIIFPGYVDVPTLQALVAGAELMVFPSLYEGFGIPLLESFAVGTPVLAANIPPFEEIAQGENCQLFDQTSLAEMQKNLYTLLVERKMGSRPIQSGNGTLQRYSWERSAVLLLSSYRQLLSL
ncbi:MAG: glycosyltransferase family 1 protein [Candidatus Moraniibacteriota bacterium]|nr:MAG: glycosyltransferase family 1 protein [Candidatus Moranbacteria bacterium]